ncbi:MAG: hypothetical protein V1913_14485 [Fibrobacterota bacterium]
MLEYRPCLRLAYFLLSCAIYLLALFLFPQTVLTVRDEANYLGAARFMLEHRSLNFELSAASGDGLIPWFEEHNGHKAPLHPLGLSFLVLPFLALFGMKGAYFFQLLLFLLGGHFFRKILERRNIPASFQLLYLFFPPFILYGRFFLADMPSAVFLLGALNFLDRNNASSGPALMGIACLGAAFIVKPVNALFIAPLALLFLVRTFRERRFLPIVLFMATGALFFCLQLFINHATTGRLFEFSYRTGAMFDWENVRENAPFYLLALCACYPAMLAGLGSFFRKQEWFLLATFANGLLFYSFFSYIDYDANPLLSLVRGQRFLLPYNALLLIGYAALLARIGPFVRFFTRFHGLFLAVGLAAVLLVAAAHDGFAAGNRTMRDWVYSHIREGDDAAIVYNIDSSEFIHGLYGKRNYRIIRSGDEFTAAFAEVMGKYKRILIVETNHVFRKGPSYIAPLLKGPLPAGYRIDAQVDHPPYRMLCLVRSD